MTAGQLIREARLRAALSQRELGQRIGRPGPQIARWESGTVDPGFAVVQRVVRVCGFDLDESLVSWRDEFRDGLEENLRRSPAERFARALQRCAQAGMEGYPRDILGHLEAERVGYCLIGGLAASIRGAERLSISVDIAPAVGPENEHRLGRALRLMGAKPTARTLLSRLEGVSDVKTRAGLLRVVVRPLGDTGVRQRLASRQRTRAPWLRPLRSGAADTRERSAAGGHAAIDRRGPAADRRKHARPRADGRRRGQRSRRPATRAPAPRGARSSSTALIRSARE